MSSGRLGVFQPTANTLTTVYTVPTGIYSVVNVSVTNTNSSAITFQLALTTNPTSPNPADYIEWNTSVVGNGVFERTGLVLNAGLSIVIMTNTAGVNVTAYGIETSTA